jgi:hypothetical protein
MGLLVGRRVKLLRIVFISMRIGRECDLFLRRLDVDVVCMTRRYAHVNLAITTAECKYKQAYICGSALWQ